jgi:hypothetical protein
MAGHPGREQLEHVIRAAATIAADAEIVVIGSQAILGRYPNAPAELLVSADVDVYPRSHPERADLIPAHESASAGRSRPTPPAERPLGP